jgi:4'-phosphopantetheinyl transferase
MADRPLLSRNAVHVWLADLDQPAWPRDRLIGTLSDDEQERAARFVFERDRQRFVAGRAILRSILAHYLHTTPERLRFCYGGHGKPALAPTPARDGLEFNLAHSQGLALYAIALGRRVGVDLEFRRPLPGAEQIAQHFFSPREYETLRALPAADKTDAFLSCWTRKEAFIKALGTGMSQPLDGFTVTVTPGEPVELLSVEGDPHAGHRWLLCELSSDPGFVAALCVEGRDCEITCQHWESASFRAP